jgi:hypothetical protein
MRWHPGRPGAKLDRSSQLGAHILCRSNALALIGYAKDAVTGMLICIALQHNINTKLSKLVQGRGTRL